MNNFSTMPNESNMEGCGNNSRPDSFVDITSTCHSVFPVNVSTKRSSAAFIILRLKQLEEERAMQQRIWEIEKMFLEQEKQNIREKYRLLEEQYCRQRKATKRIRQTYTVTTVEHNPLHVDQVHKQQKSAFESELLIQPTQMDFSSDRSQLDGTQQPKISAIPKSILKGQTIDRRVTTPDVPLSFTSNRPLPTQSNDNFSNALLVCVTVNSTAVEKMDQKINIKECKCDCQLRKPSDLVPLNVPEPDPPPQKFCLVCGNFRSNSEPGYDHIMCLSVWVGQRDHIEVVESQYLPTECYFPVKCIKNYLAWLINTKHSCRTVLKSGDVNYSSWQEKP
ncbi:uncharacterized protein LOC134206863 [Armigeres subalbatus]|uniref:uncharacterized protein LOC134206863 n=1 Tax=Armigeres subalbatus TaxID=124917 RepID=UPI002ED2B87C